MTRPNILILYTDQQRWDAIGANNNPHIHTPNLDALAGAGANFDHCFVQSPLCMPSRVSFLTGQYPSTLRITHMGVNVPADTVTMANLFGQYGYHCANLGKLHFQTHANRDHRESHPTYGFDHLEISDEPGVYEDAYRAWVRRHAPDQLDHLSVGLPPATAVWKREMGFNDGITHPSKEPRNDFLGAIPFSGDENFTHTAFVAERTLEFLDRHTGQQPFMCISGFYSPHAPWVVPQRFLDLYDRDSLPFPNFSAEEEAKRQALGWTDDYLREDKQGYYAMVSEVDHHIGRVIEKLRQTNQLDNTLIVFTSDHGEWLGDGVRFGKGYPGDDGSTRVPLVIAGPDIEPQQISDLTEAVDVLPTLLELSEIQVLPHLNGRSLANQLLNRPFAPRTSAITEFTGWRCLRTIDFRYLIHTDGKERLWSAEGQELDPRDYPEQIAEIRQLLLQRMLDSERPMARSWPY
ncbi:MAG: sulfatase-like hydrolase/transferase [Chloroflexota bacterium]